MKVLIQRVKSASVSVNGDVVGEIGRGLLLFLGIAKEDTGAEIEFLVKKIVELRIFENEESKFDLSVKDVGGELLLISQFTLCGSCDKGRRPDFFDAAEPFRAKKIYDDFVMRLSQEGIKVATGKFGEYMQVKLENDGPVTFLLEKGVRDKGKGI
ncbi:MAG: D-tyrosyl-tRNA(Tyr) deacylase [Parcubacteria group bacterium GW2011_GWC2_38_7]|nr:MAG: D-tyrosyl-tRNA(Tyr) deacylase [Parcubacteria group bacterium GW2011_GWC2_38_7]